MLKFGMIGGGLGSYIGKFHRWGAMLDDSAELVCGCFSRSMDKNRATAEAYHLPDTSRVYADFREMADKESTREDGIDFVSIMTANDTHYEIAKCFLSMASTLYATSRLRSAPRKPRNLPALRRSAVCCSA